MTGMLDTGREVITEPFAMNVLSAKGHELLAQR